VYAAQPHAVNRGRPLAIAGGVALAAILLLPSLAAAAPGASASVSGDRLTATVSGGSRTGMWRIRVVAPGGRERIDFVVRTGDITWNGIVRVSRLTDGRWTVVGKRQLSGTRSALEPASGSGAGVRWSTSSFRLPSKGDARFSMTARLTRSGTYRVVGAVRNAVEAFTYGSWTAVGSSTVSH
jgi:hypothetical protein